MVELPADLSRERGIRHHGVPVEQQIVEIEDPVL